MTQHKHPAGDHAHHGHEHEHRGGLNSRGLHKDWRTWMVVLTMIAGIFIYVVTMDESEGPGANPTGLETPAAAE